MTFDNVYEDAKRAEAYAKLEFPGTYYLAYRDLPAIISEHVLGKKGLDFGCGAGRSMRFMRKLGFDAIGVDISEDMIKKAHELDPIGNYLLVGDADLSTVEENKYDLALSVFTFDNIPTSEKKSKCFKKLAGLLNPNGKIVSLVSSPDIYMHEWASFTTKDFPENKLAKSGDTVKIIMTDVDDRRPVIDILCTDETYREIYRQAGLKLIKTYRPLAKPSEPYNWVSETQIAPWVIYVLERF